MKQTEGRVSFPLDKGEERKWIEENVMLPE